MKAPSIFKPLDIIFFLPLILACVACTCAVWAADVGLQAQLLMTTVTLLFIGIAIRVLQARRDFIKSYDLALSFNIWVKLNGYSASWTQLAEELHRVIDLYETLYPNVREIFKQSPVWVEFVREPLKTSTGARVSGYVIGDMVKVSFAVAGGRGAYTANPNVPVRHTAFAHELAHVVIGRATGQWSNATHHALMEKIDG